MLKWRQKGRNLIRGLRDYANVMQANKERERLIENDKILSCMSRTYMQGV